MRFGVCVTVDKEPIERAKRIGFDYIELPLLKLLELNDNQLEELKIMLDKIGIYAETYNCFFGNMRLTGDDVDMDKIADYAETVLKRASFLGGRVAVIGSGGQRRIPDGFDRDTAEKQFINILNVCGDIAGKYGMKIAVEPLNTLETNLINTVSECAELVAKADNKNVGVLADYYHIFMNSEGLNKVADKSTSLIHTHLARADKDRKLPHLGRDDEAVKLFADALKAHGYEGAISLEGHYDEDVESDWSKALEFMKKYF